MRTIHLLLALTLMLSLSLGTGTADAQIRGPLVVTDGWPECTDLDTWTRDIFRLDGLPMAPRSRKRSRCSTGYACSIVLTARRAAV